MFTVPSSAAGWFLHCWRDTAHVFSRSAGFRRARIHRAQHGHVVQFVHVADWDDQRSLLRAQASPEFRAATQRLLTDPTLRIAVSTAVSETLR